MITYAQQMEALEHLLREVSLSDEKREIIYAAPGIKNESLGVGFDCTNEITLKVVSDVNQHQ